MHNQNSKTNVEVLEIADLQAHNTVWSDALQACRSVIFKSVGPSLGKHLISLQKIWETTAIDHPLYQYFILGNGLPQSLRQSVFEWDTELDSD